MSALLDEDKRTFVPETGEEYNAVVVRSKQSGKNPVCHIETEPGKFSGMAVFLESNGESEPQPGDFLRVQVVKVANNGRFAFATKLSADD